MKKMRFFKILISVLSALAFTATAVAADLPKVTWKVQSCCPGSNPKFIKKLGLKRTPESIGVGSGDDLTQELSRAVSARTNGRFQLKHFAYNELFATTEAYEALEKGAIDFWFGPPWAFSGRNPFGHVSSSLPYSLTNHDQAYDIMFNTDLEKLPAGPMQKIISTTSVGSMGGADGITSTFPINTMEDLKGKKVRGGGIKGKVVKALGAIDVTISPAEIYSALERGMIDGLLMPF